MRFRRNNMNHLFPEFTKTPEKHFLITTFILLLFLSLSSYAVTEDRQASKPDPLRFEKEIDSFLNWDTKNSIPDDAILFVGSSSIRLWATHDSFPEIKVINRGFGGSHISDVIYYSERIVLPYKPKLIVFYAGDNDIAFGKTPQQVFHDYEQFIKIVHDKLPKTPIIYIGIKPSRSRWSYWPAMKEANEMIAGQCEENKSLYYFDSSLGILGEDGMPIEKMFTDDQLHMSKAGYEVWTANLRPHISEVLRHRQFLLKSSN